MPEKRLTELASGGGCGCKLPPDALRRLLQQSAIQSLLPPNLLVGNDTADDAAVWRLNDEMAIVATVDFFAPLVDDALLFGQIAATNAISDVYAMGAKPLFALALAAMPKNQLSEESIAKIFMGGQLACQRAGIVIGGGHSIDAQEPLYGLAVIGQVHPDRLLTNAGAKGGDCLLLSKQLGVGVMSAANKKAALSVEGYKEWTAQLIQLNDLGEKLSTIAGVHALTDVTGFGLLGHLTEMCAASQCGAKISLAQLPIMSEAIQLAQQGVSTGAQKRNWQCLRHKIQITTPLAPWQEIIISDPQTSGGLLMACHPDAVAEIKSLYAPLSLCCIGTITDTADTTATPPIEITR